MKTFICLILCLNSPVIWAQSSGSSPGHIITENRYTYASFLAEMGVSSSDPGYQELLRLLQERHKILYDDQLLALGAQMRRMDSRFPGQTSRHSYRNLSPQDPHSDLALVTRGSENESASIEPSASEEATTVFDAIFVARFVLDAINSGQALTSSIWADNLPYIMPHTYTEINREYVEENAKRMHAARSQVSVPTEELQQKLIDLLVNQFMSVTQQSTPTNPTQMRIIKATLLNLIALTGGQMPVRLSLNAPGTNWFRDRGAVSALNWRNDATQTNQGAQNYMSYAILINALFFGGVGLSAYVASNIESQPLALTAFMAGFVTTLGSILWVSGKKRLPLTVDYLFYLFWRNSDLKQAINTVTEKLAPHAMLPTQKSLQARWFFDLWLHPERALTVIKKNPQKSSDQTDLISFYTCGDLFNEDPVFHAQDSD